MSEPHVCVSNLKKKFGEKEVLKDVSLSVASGEVFGLVGLNGAGKTTLIRQLLGLIKIDGGRCAILGMDPAKMDKEFYRHVGVVLEHNGFFGNLTVMENIGFFAGVKGIDGRVAEDYFSEWWKGSSIDDRKGKVKLFSRGQKMQCAMCRAFLGWPEVFFLDEPAVALDVNAYDHFCRLVRHARDRGAAVIISSHQLDAVEDLCDTVGILEDGRLAVVDPEIDHTDSERWLVRCPGDETFGNIIKGRTGRSAEYRNGCWRFQVSRNTDSRIPEIVSDLVSAGCSIFEVRKEERVTLRESIRKYYDPKKENSKER